jgi:hypothetical protein
VHLSPSYAVDQERQLVSLSATAPPGKQRTSEPKQPSSGSSPQPQQPRGGIMYRRDSLLGATREQAAAATSLRGYSAEAHPPRPPSIGHGRVRVTKAGTAATVCSGRRILLNPRCGAGPVPWAITVWCTQCTVHSARRRACSHSSRRRLLAWARASRIHLLTLRPRSQ